MRHKYRTSEAEYLEEYERDALPEPPNSGEHSRNARFVQLVACGEPGPETLVALDEDGNVWIESRAKNEETQQWETFWKPFPMERRII